MMAMFLSAASTGDPLLGPGFRRRLRNPHQRKLFSPRTHQNNQHWRKLSFRLRVRLLSHQPPVGRRGGSETDHIPPSGRLCCEDQRSRAGRGVGEQQGEVWAEIVSRGEAAGETLHPWRGAAGQGDKEATLGGGKWLLYNASALCNSSVTEETCSNTNNTAVMLLRV